MTSGEKWYNRKQEAGSRKQEAGSRKQEAGSHNSVSNSTGIIRKIYRVLPLSVRQKFHIGDSLKGLKIFLKLALSLPLKRPLEKIQFEIHLAEHCNLNCAGCNNFSPIAEPEFVDINEFKRDFERLGNLFDHESGRIYLLGGEPLLHPEIIALMKIARENFVMSDISVFTNGILLPQQGEDFWQACRDNNIKIIISAYPIKIDTDKIESMSKKFGVKTEWAWGQSKNERDTFNVDAINLSGDSDIKKNFAWCGRANYCITLSHGRLFTCSFAPHAHHFNKKFNKNVNITDADSVDIYKENDKNAILKKLSQPIPACRYCYTVPSPKQKKIQWHVSQGDINEWL